MMIKDLQTGRVREYGSGCHDSLEISQDGRTLSYCNLQNGDGSRFGDYRFVMEDSEVPEDSKTPEAMNCCCYFNIGGFADAKEVYNKAIEDFVEALEHYSEFARPVGWSGEIEIIQMSTIRDIVANILQDE